MFQKSIVLYSVPHTCIVLYQLSSPSNVDLLLLRGFKTIVSIDLNERSSLMSYFIEKTELTFSLPRISSVLHAGLSGSDKHDLPTQT